MINKITKIYGERQPFYYDLKNVIRSDRQYENFLELNEIKQGVLKLKPTNALISYDTHNAVYNGHLFRKYFNKNLYHDKVLYKVDRINETITNDETIILPHHENSIQELNALYLHYDDTVLYEIKITVAFDVYYMLLNLERKPIVNKKQLSEMIDNCITIDTDEAIVI